jgi:Protein of unknown function (DUF3634)
VAPDWLIPLVVLAAIAAAAWHLAQPRCAFVVRIVAGVPHASDGAVTPAFLQQVKEVCVEHDIRQGIVRGIIRGSRIALAFSHDIPPAAQQQLRNWWGLSGWAAPQRRR